MKFIVNEIITERCDRICINNGVISSQRNVKKVVAYAKISYTYYNIQTDYKTYGEGFRHHVVVTDPMLIL